MAWALGLTLRMDGGDVVFDCRVGAGVAALANLARQPQRTQIGIGSDALTSR